MNIGFAIVGFIIGIVVAGWGGHFLIGAFGGLGILNKSKLVVGPIHI